MAKDINNTAFDDATKLKLDIFGECFEEWLPVFNNDPYTKKIYVFDFFAGNGKDLGGNSGSPLVLLDKARGQECQYCKKSKKEIKFIFNEGIKRKSTELKRNIENYLQSCEKNNGCPYCIYQYSVENHDFQNIYSDSKIIDILNNKDFGKFILLDQYGFKEIDEDIFKQLITFPKTDFIFFISSSFIYRFKEHPNTTRYINTSKISFENIKPTEIHRAIANYFRDLIPKEKEYYLHHFSIRKEANKGNYYGLIFGSNHTLGMEKFLKVCWKHDAFSGEANYNIDNNFEEGSLFYNPENTIKKESIKEKLEELILSGTIKNNVRGFKYVMNEGCEPTLFTEIVKKLEKENKIIREGNLNYNSTRIHRVEEYQIKRL
ncbi:MAG: three-Cys-motif partner protein TcmP [Victivallales bacterium]